MVISFNWDSRVHSTMSDWLTDSYTFNIYHLIARISRIRSVGQHTASQRNIIKHTSNRHHHYFCLVRGVRPFYFVIYCVAWRLIHNFKLFSFSINYKLLPCTPSPKVFRRCRSYIKILQHFVLKVKDGNFSEQRRWRVSAGFSSSSCACKWWKNSSGGILHS